MNRNNIVPFDQAEAVGQVVKKKRFVRSLEYELIASLAFQQYAKNEEANFEGLLSILLKDRIPSLIQEYGLKRMHQLVKTILQEFCYTIPLPKSKKLTETRISVCACDLILAAGEDQLSIEDLIVFFELARNGNYGRFKGMVTHVGIMQKLGQFRQERYEAYVRIKELREAEQKAQGPTERISPEPTAIKQLFVASGAKIVPFKKIS
jgi:hypothetical protein